MSSEKVLPLIKISSDDTKQTIRKKVWDYLEEHKIAALPLPPHQRIPNFKTSKELGAKVGELDLFKLASILKIDPDKPLQQIRYEALEAHKTIFVPTPKLASNFLNKITTSANQQINWIRSSRLGITEHSSPVVLDGSEKVDLIIVGAVAVSPNGWRIGKGEGYSDMEYALMSALNMIDSEVKIIAVVHDSQVLDLPIHLFQEHDVPVDVIITPTRVIHCNEVDKSIRILTAKPNGIIWNLLSQEKVDKIPVLQKIRYLEWKAGKKVLLNGQTELPGELKDDVDLKKVSNTSSTMGRNFASRRFNQRRFAGGNRYQRYGSGYESNNNNQRDNVNRKYNRSGSARKSDSHKDTDKNVGGSGDYKNQVGEKGETISGQQQNMPTKVRGYSNKNGEGWLYVGNIPWTIRVSDFKAKIREVEANPIRVIWHGTLGYSFLNFQSVKDAEDAALVINGLGMKNRVLRAEVAKKRKDAINGKSEDLVESATDGVQELEVNDN